MGTTHTKLIKIKLKIVLHSVLVGRSGQENIYNCQSLKETRHRE